MSSTNPEERGADVIVMGAHHHNLLDRLLTNDTTPGEILEEPCPVLVAGPRASRND